MMKITVLFSALLIFTGMHNRQIREANCEPATQEQKPLFTFGILADVQYCNCEPAGTRFYGASPPKLREAVNDFIADSVTFLINLGDLIEKDFSSFNPVMNILDSSGLKVYHITGNHDYQVEDRYKRRIPVLTENRDGYYSFNIGEFRFIALNGNEISTYASTRKSTINEASALIDKLKAEGEPNAMEWNGAIGPDQMRWFTGQLDAASANNEQVIVLCHFPVWPQDEHNLLNYKDVLSLIEKYSNIIAWFSGHNHKGNYGNFNMIHFVTFRGMVETETSGSHAIVEVYKNKIWIKGGGREKSQILAI